MRSPHSKIISYLLTLAALTLTQHMPAASFSIDLSKVPVESQEPEAAVFGYIDGTTVAAIIKDSILYQLKREPSGETATKSIKLSTADEDNNHDEFADDHLEEELQGIKDELNAELELKHDKLLKWDFEKIGRDTFKFEHFFSDGNERVQSRALNFHLENDKVFFTQSMGLKKKSRMNMTFFEVYETGLSPKLRALLWSLRYAFPERKSEEQKSLQ